MFILPMKARTVTSPQIVHLNNSSVIVVASDSDKVQQIKLLVQSLGINLYYYCEITAF